MIKSLLTLRSAALGLIVAGVAAAPAHADGTPPPPPVKTLSPVDTSACTQAPFSQPFASFGDYGFYTLVPGQSVDDFAGTGWALGDGASIVTTTLDDGTTGQVLNLSGGSSAVSPPMCVASNYPAGGTMIRDITGSKGVQFYVSYEGSNTWEKPRNTGQLHGDGTAWTLSQPFNLQPYHTDGWQIVRFGLTVGKHSGDYQLYNLYVDPHMLR
jgi:hypothetical protein